MIPYRQADRGARADIYTFRPRLRRRPCSGTYSRPDPPDRQSSLYPQCAIREKIAALHADHAGLGIAVQLELTRSSR